MSREVREPGVPAPSAERKAAPVAALPQGAGGPARSEIRGMGGAFVRENREVPCLLVRVACGRDAGGTLRR